jgi:hypothetical protein
VLVAPRANDNLGEISALLDMRTANLPAHLLSGAIVIFVTFWAFATEPSGAVSIDAPARSPAPRTQIFGIIPQIQGAAARARPAAGGSAGCSRSA